MNDDISFEEFCFRIDGEGHPRGWKREAYRIFLAGETKVFYPTEHPGCFKWRVNGSARTWERSVDDGGRDDDVFAVHQVFDIRPSKLIRYAFGRESLYDHHDPTPDPR